MLRERHYPGYLLEDAPVKVMQFGEGGFLRAFIDYFIDEMNEKANFNCKVVVVQPRGGHPEVSDRFRSQDGLYTLLLRGKENGRNICRERIISCIDRCLDPKTEWEEIVSCMEQPELRFVISNTTEAGIAYEPGCRREDTPPAAYPAKLLALLLHRFELGLPGLWILPCELNERNGELLQKVLYQYMDDWAVPDEFRSWFKRENHVCSTLVDRIVTGYPRAEAEELCRERGYEDKLIDTAEVFGLWVVEAPEDIKKELPFEKAQLPVLVTENCDPYKLRKVRILNGAHTAMAMGAYLSGKNNVRECMEDKVIRSFIEKAIYQEIIPTLDLPREELESFAASVAERFANPYIDHSLLSISLNSAAKWRERVLPSVCEYYRRFGTLPKCLTESFALWAAFCRNAKERDETGLIGWRGSDRYSVQDDAFVLDVFYANRNNDAGQLVNALVNHQRMWNGSLEKLPGFAEAVTEGLKRIEAKGAYAVMEECAL